MVTPHLSFDHHDTETHRIFDRLQIVRRGDGVGEGECVVAVCKELPRAIQHLGGGLVVVGGLINGWFGRGW